MSVPLLVRTVSRFRAARSRVRTPADAWLLVRMLAWAATLPLLKRVLPLPQLVRLTASRPRRSGGLESGKREQLAAFARWIYGQGVFTRDPNCLERSLVAYRFLTRAGADPRLMVGLAKAREGIVGHAWVVVDGRPLNDSPVVLEEFVPVIEFGADGSRREKRS
jgi:hypothetical protein